MKSIMVLLAFFLTHLTILSGQEQWLTDFEAAQALAQTDNRNILLVFQGSDWCAPCIRMEEELWHTETFLDFAEEEFILVKADFPRRRKNRLSDEQTAHNRALAERYNKQGYFPFIVVLTPAGNIITQHSYEKRSPEEYIRFITSKTSR